MNCATGSSDVEPFPKAVASRAPSHSACRQSAPAVNLLWYILVEAWAWWRREEELVARPVWDAEDRRPSHVDKRRALQREILRAEIQAVVGERSQWQEFQHIATRLLDLAA
jgi:hypothetical protein